MVCLDTFDFTRP